RGVAELVARRLAASLLVRRGRCVDGGCLDVFVLRQRVHLGAMLEQHSSRIDMTEETGEAEGMETVVAERVRERLVLREELAEPVRVSQGSRLQHVQVGVLGEQLVHSSAIAAVHGWEQL